uniref:Gap junction protein n=1 Tax=Hucho hucho TaxID=62062 RepID=A0A4W5LC13_9TELE
MGDWNFLGGILEEVHIHSTMVGKIWLTILFIFRMLVLGVAAEDVWNDEQTDFICNTEQPGCRNVCYDRAFPISLIRYWVLQVIFVSSPSLVYMGHAIYQLRALEKTRHTKRAALRRELEAVDVELIEVRRRIEREMRQLDLGKLNKAPLRGSLLQTYVAHIVTRSVVEVGFMMGQYLLYGHHLDPLFKCEREPCPNLVDCFVSRPTEKTVFMMFMQAIAAVSLFLSLLEIMHLSYRKLKKGILAYHPHLKDDYNHSKSKINSDVKQVNMGGTSGGCKPVIPSGPSGYTLLIEKQGNGPTHSLLNSSSAFVPIQVDPGDEPKDLVVHPLPQHVYPPVLPLMDASSCPTLSVIARKPRRVSAPWNCSTVVEGNGSDSGDSFPGTISMKPLSRHSRDGNSPPVCSPNRRMSLASNGSSRRAPGDLQI